MNDFAAIGLRIQGEYVRDGSKSQPLRLISYLWFQLNSPCSDSLYKYMKFRHRLKPNI